MSQGFHQVRSLIEEFSAKGLRVTAQRRVLLEIIQSSTFESPVFERLKQEIAREQGFHIGVVRMEVGGRCSTCVQSSK
jgi:Fe2+ or Zn2+ uptake regulation protein